MRTAYSEAARTAPPEPPTPAPGTPVAAAAASARSGCPDLDPDGRIRADTEENPVLLALLAACAPSADLTFSPAAVDFGEVDFTGEMPDEGYANETVTVRNDGGATLTAWLAAYDTDHLCINGFPEDFAYPAELGPLGPGDSYTLNVGVCAYVSGEVGTEVATEVVVQTDGKPADLHLPITFTPVRDGE